MIIYKVTNLINGSVYIGQTIKTLRERKSSHLRKIAIGNNVYFHNAIRKYGVDNFKWQVICICPNIDILNEQEEYYIAFYDSMNGGYNLTSGGNNYIVSIETKNKIRNISLNMSNETKEKMRQAKLGKKLTEEHKRKIGIAITGRGVSISTRKKISDAQLGKKHWNYGKRLSEETKQKMSEIHKRLGTKPPSHKGLKRSEETIKRMKTAQKKWRLLKKNNL